MATIGDGFKDIFLAGIGAMAVTAEKGKDLVDQLIEKGELTVDQGKQINTELKHKAESTAATVREDLLEARMVAMTPEERAAFVAKAAEIAQKVDARAAAAAQVGDASPVETVAAATPCHARRARCPADARRRRAERGASDARRVRVRPASGSDACERRLPMAENTLLKYFFSSGANIDPEDRFHLNRRTRMRRLREISDILRKHHFLKGFAPEEFRAMLEDLGPSFVKIGQNAVHAVGDPSEGVLRRVGEAADGVRAVAVRGHAGGA